MQRFEQAYSTASKNDSRRFSQAERRKPSGELLKNKTKTVGLAPRRYKVDAKVSDIGQDARAPPGWPDETVRMDKLRKKLPVRKPIGFQGARLSPFCVLLGSSCGIGRQRGRVFPRNWPESDPTSPTLPSEYGGVPVEARINITRDHKISPT